MESLRGRKLRHLFRTLPASQSSPASARVAAAFSSCCLAHNQRARRMEAALLPLCGQYYWTAAAARKGMAEQVRREGLSSTRWNPTKEQLRALEELYARGTRTPPAHQIQLIAAQLRRYGRIEGKNVFYWFQNHKARERQRLRRQAEEEAAAAAAAAASDDDDHNKQDSAGGAAPADSEVLIKQESKSLAPGKPYSSTPPATTSAAVARGRGEETAHSPWLLSHDQQGFAEGGAASQDTSQHQFPLGAGAAVSSGHCNKLVRSWASCGVLAGELDAEEEEEEEKPTTTLELFPLRSEKKNHHLVLGSSSACCNWKPSMISSHSHVQFFQFL